MKGPGDEGRDEAEIHRVAGEAVDSVGDERTGKVGLVWIDDRFRAAEEKDTGESENGADR